MLLLSCYLVTKRQVCSVKRNSRSTTAESPSSSSSSSSSSLYEWSLSLVANYSTVTPRIPRERNQTLSIRVLGGRRSPLHRYMSKGKQEAFFGAMHGRCRGLPVLLRAGCIHPFAPAAPLLHHRSRFRRDDCRISLYIRFSSFMILHKLIQLDNQREKLTHVS